MPAQTLSPRPVVASTNLLPILESCDQNVPVPDPFESHLWTCAGKRSCPEGHQGCHLDSGHDGRHDASMRCHGKRCVPHSRRAAGTNWRHGGNGDGHGCRRVADDWVRGPAEGCAEDGAEAARDDGTARWLRHGVRRRNAHLCGGAMRQHVGGFGQPRG